MRLVAQARLGFYPAHPEAVSELVKHLRLGPPNPNAKNQTFNIIDPCAGEGAAVKQIAEAIGITQNHVYCVELDGGRTARIREAMPEANLLGPASFLGTQITGGSFGVAYVNPPFDDQLGGKKREEEAFASRAIKLLVPHGVLVLVCPLRALNGNTSFVTLLDSQLEDIAIFKFPDEQRHYNEIVVFGRKRKMEIPTDAVRKLGSLHQRGFQWSGAVMDLIPVLGECQPKSYDFNGYPSSDREEQVRHYEVPGAVKPHVFKKTAFTDDELVAAISDSPLNRLLKEVVIPPPARPPLPLDKGHLGLILASGILDGTVQSPHGVHVVRGSSFKSKYHNKEASMSEQDEETGAVTTKDVYSERMITCIRAVEQDGVIYTHSNEPKKVEESDLDEPQPEQKRRYA